MTIDLILAAFFILVCIQGYRRGFMATLFALLGYLLGGAIGLFIAKLITSSWNGLLSIVGCYLLAMFIGAQIGTLVLAKVGVGLHKRVLFGPFKLMDS